MAIPLIYFLYLYLVILFLGALFAFFNIYHMARFSFYSFTAFLTTALFCLGVAAILLTSLVTVSGFNWQIDWQILPGGWFDIPTL